MISNLLKYCFFTGLVFLAYSFNAQKHYDFKLSKVSYDTEETKVAIKFDIKNFENDDRFNISVLAIE